MNKAEFLKKLEVELKISKNSEHTIKNYISANEKLLDKANKKPKEITEDDVKMYVADKMEDSSSSSVILFLSAIKYAYMSILKKDITIDIKRPKKETHLPVIVDPSHGTGKYDLISPMSNASVACGADGLMIEVHPNPEDATSDGDQSLTPAAFAKLIEKLKPVAKAVHRTL
mgnify:CR=1 FL=1